MVRLWSIGLLWASIWAGASLRAEGQTRNSASAPETFKSEARDFLGDPLPAGAVTRIGTMRLRHFGTARATFSPDGKHIFSLGEDDHFQVWSAEDGKEVRRFSFSSIPGNRGRALEEIMLMGNMGQLQMQMGWRRQMMFRGQDVLPPDAVVHSADGQWLAVMDRLGGAVIWDASTGRELFKATVKYQAGHALAFSTNSKLLAMGDCGDEECLIRIWDVAGAKEIMNLKLPKGHAPSRLLFSPDGQYLASVETAELRLWHMPTGKRVRLYQGHENMILGVAFSPNGKLLGTAGADKTIRIWEIESEEEVAKLSHPELPFQTLAFSPTENNLLAAGNGQEVTLWAWATATALKQFSGHSQPVTSVAFSPDGKTLLSACMAGTMRLWDVKTGQEKLDHRGLEQVPSKIFAEDKDKLRVIFQDGSGVRLDSKTGKVLAKFVKPAEMTNLMGVSGNGQYLTFPDREGNKVIFWDTLQGKEIFSLAGEEVQHYLGHGFSPDNQFLAVGKTETIHIYKLPGKKEVARLHQVGPASLMTFSPDNKTLVTLGANIQLWEVATGRQRLQFPGPSNGLANLAFSRDGRFLAGSGVDEIVRVWDTMTGKLVHGMIGHQGVVTETIFAPGGNVLASAGEDGQVRLWNYQTGKLLRSFPGHRGHVMALTFSADGTRLFSGSRDSTLLVWDLTAPDPTPAETAKLQDLERLWKELGEEDAKVAYRALGELVERPTETLAFLKSRLQPVPHGDPQAMLTLIANLDHDNFLVRDRALRELEKLAGQAEGAVQKALDGKPSPEAAQRLRNLLEKLEAPPTDAASLRTLRSLEVLEKIGTPEAQNLVNLIAQGAPQARLTREAQATLKRLNRR